MDHVVVPRETPDPYSAETFGGHENLLSMVKAVRESGTNTGTLVGARAHLINKDASRRMRELNTTHAACLGAARDSSVGMGHRDDAIYDVLDPLCRFGWQDILDAAGDDLVGEGDGFVEVVWDERRTEVKALNHLDGNQVHVVIEQENDSERIHYQVQGATAVRETVAMAAWGDLLDLRERYEGRGGLIRNAGVSGEGSLLAPLGGRIVNSEVIHLREPTSRDPFQGYPYWISATPIIELMQMMVRHEFDYHFNRGVPELLISIAGGGLNEKDWEEIKRIFRSQQGLGQSGKTAALRFTGGPDSVRVQVDRLGDARSQDFFDEKANTLAMLIATAHGIPPVLANVILPGKIGAANEAPNALMLFQKRRLGQIQRRVSRVLANTLGSGVRLGQPEGAAKTLSKEQFLGTEFADGTDDNGSPIFHERGNGFKTVLDGMSLGAMDTMARMREPITGSGRNPEDGLLDGADDRRRDDPRRTR